MARKLTKKELNLMVSELLAIKPIFDRFRELEKQVKRGMVDLELIGDENAIEAQGGRVFITTSERVSISPELAERVLAGDAERVIVVKRSVPNTRVEELVKAGIISDEAFEAMWSAAERKPVVNLYIRPLK